MILFRARKLCPRAVALLLPCLALISCSKSSNESNTAAPAASNAPSSQQQWIKGWRETARLSINRAGTAAVAHNGYLYVIGGVDGREFTPLVEYAKINPDGSLQAFKTGSPLMQERGFIDATVYAGYIFVVGGGNGPSGHNLLRSVERAKINPDGSLSAWELEKNSMLTPRRCSKVFQHNGYIYAAGGFAGALLDTVERAKIDEDGHLSNWQVEDQRMTMPRYVNSVSAMKTAQGKISFVIGGHDQSKGVGISDVEWARPDDKGSIGNWAAAPALQVGRYGLSSAKHGRFLYALGGLTGLEYLNSVEMAELDEQGQLSAWRFTTPMIQARATFSALVYNDTLYIIGGTNQDRYFNTVSYAQINGQGEIGFWGSAREAEAYHKQQQTLASHQDQLPNHGVVKIVRQASMYTYLLVTSDQGDTWLAGPKLDVAVGDKVGFSKGVTMSSFRSKELQQTFEKILFVGKLQKE